jgi:hypothetical protein
LVGDIVPTFRMKEEAKKETSTEREREKERERDTLVVGITVF